MVALENTLTLNKNVTKKVKIVEQETFTKDLKLMLGKIYFQMIVCMLARLVLVGIVSKTFLLDENGEFALNSDISLANYTPSALKQYVGDFTFCGSCYRALTTFVTPDAHTGQYREQGYIFAVSLAKFVL